LFVKNPELFITNSVVAIIVLAVLTGAVIAVDTPVKVALINLLSTYCLVATPNAVVGSAATSTVPVVPLIVMYLVEIPSTVAKISTLPPLVLLITQA
jgi:hypothetical protein